MSEYDNSLALFYILITTAGAFLLLLLFCWVSGKFTDWVEKRRSRKEIKPFTHRHGVMQPQGDAVADSYGRSRVGEIMAQETQRDRDLRDILSGTPEYFGYKQDELEDALDEIMNAPEHKHRWQVITEDYPNLYDRYLLYFACFGCEMVLGVDRAVTREVVKGTPGYEVGWSVGAENENIMAMESEVCKFPGSYFDVSLYTFGIRGRQLAQEFTNPKE